MVIGRRGTARLGCIAALIFVGAVGYFSFNVGRVALGYYRFEDRMKQEARFAAKRTDAQIRDRLIAFADSLGLPEGAHHVHVRRVEHVMYIWSDYYLHVELPGYVREVRLSPQVSGAF